MTFWEGVITGAGWGVFVGFIIGVTWLKSFIAEMSDDAEKRDRK